MAEAARYFTPAQENVSLPVYGVSLDGRVATAHAMPRLLEQLLSESLIKLPLTLLQSSLSCTPPPSSSPSHTPVMHDGSPRAEIDPTRAYLAHGIDRHRALVAEVWRVTVRRAHRGSADVQLPVLLADCNLVTWALTRCQTHAVCALAWTPRSSGCCSASPAQPVSRLSMW